MNFDCFAHLRVENNYLATCLDACYEAERNVRTRPRNTAIEARRAIENLFMHQSKLHGLKPRNLAQSIQDNCDALENNSEIVRQKADSIRRCGNKAVHPETGKKISQAEALSYRASVDAATKKNIEDAMGIVKGLFELLALLYGNPENREFRTEDVPFDHFIIDRPITSPYTYAREEYFVHQNVGYRTYFYLQCLSLQDEVELEARRLEASQRLYENFSFNRRIALPNMEIALPLKSDRKLMLYQAGPQAMLLSELNKPLTIKQAMKLGMDIADALLQLKALGMHHRNIFPGAILLNKVMDDNYEALLLNLQTSKILDSAVTVNTHLAATYDQNLYIPSFLKLPEISGSDWEKVDVHALARVVLFCLNPKLAYATSVSAFSMYPKLQFSKQLRELYSKLFYRDPKMKLVPSVEELKELFKREYDLYNESQNQKNL